MDESSLHHFVANGFVILRGLIPHEVVESWRRQSWDVLTADRFDRSTWPAPGEEGARNLNIYTDEARAAREVWPWSGEVARAADGAVRGTASQEEAAGAEEATGGRQ